MVQASVGFHCPECVRAMAGSAPVYTAQTLPGANDKPWVTYALIALNVAAFIAQMTTLRTESDPGFNVTGNITEQGWLYGPAVGAGEWWRLVTGGFLHSGLLHIGMNMYILYILGPMMERALGHVRYAALYAAALLAGSLGVIIVSPTSPTLGASGAIFGMLGAAAAYQHANGIDIRKSGLGTLILLNVGITVFLASRLSVGGHFGGLIGGGLVGYALVWLEQKRQPMVVGLVVAAAAILVFAAAAVVLAPTGVRVR